jgi:hypothetical protein
MALRVDSDNGIHRHVICTACDSPAAQVAGNIGFQYGALMLHRRQS